MADFGQRLRDTFLRKGQLCVGIDPSVSQLSKWGLEISAAGAREFAYELIDASRREVGIVKIQVAFFEQFGPEGFGVLGDVLRRASQSELLVIADAKRGDIGSTMEGYARSWLSNEACFVCDALTVSPYLGPSSLHDTAEFAIKNEKGLFLLAATSNPEAGAVQRAISDQQSVGAKVADFAQAYSSGALGSIGLVIGATVRLDDYGLSEKHLQDLPILVPGFGAQGVSLRNAKDIFGEVSRNIVCSVSRSIAGDSREGLLQRIQEASMELKLGLAK